MFLPWISLLRVSNRASVLLSLASSFLKMVKKWWFVCWLLVMSVAADRVSELFEVLNSPAWSSSRSTSATQRWKRDKVSSATKVFIFQLLLVVLMSSPHIIYIPQGFFLCDGYEQKKPPMRWLLVVKGFFGYCFITLHKTMMSQSLSFLERCFLLQAICLRKI